MKRLFVILLIGLLVLLALPLDSHAGPWTLKKGKVWTEVYGKYFFSKNYFDSKGKAHKWGDGGFSRIYFLEGKIEYGITDRFNVRLSVPYAWNRWKNDWGKVNADWGNLKNEGFQHIGLAGKYRFLDKPLTMALWVQWFIHPDSTDTIAPDVLEYGDGIDARWIIGKSFKINKKYLGYVSTETGYFWRLRNSPYAHQFIEFAEAGVAPLDWMMVKTEVDFRYSHHGTGVRKDSLTWRIGPIFKIWGKGFNEVYKGSEASVNVELQYGRTFWGRGDGESERWGTVSLADEYIAKVQVLW